jgi:TonB-dependent receptor
MARSWGCDRVSVDDKLIRAGLRAGASALAVCTMFLSSAAWAQDEAAPATETAAAEDESEIIVTGIRESLRNAQNIKRDAETVVDAITAQDIGALPDRSVTEALQRIPGVAINRFAGSNDPDHFSVEGSGVVVRGLSFVRSEFNGRDTFSTGVYGQAINFADVPSELLGSVEVYKNLTAEMIEGGLSGIVNLNTRLPFDDPGFHLGFSLELNYGDFAEEVTPVANVLVSNTWDTGIGRIGLLANFSYSQLKSRADGLHVTNFQTRDGATVVQSNTANTQVCRNRLPGDTDSTTLPPGGAACNAAGTPGADGLADLADLRYAPLGGQFRTQDYDRERMGLAFAAQWESLDERSLLTLQYLRTESTSAWGEHSFEAAPDLSEYETYPAGCRQNTGSPQGRPRAECPVGALQNYQYDSDNIFESGFITLPGTGWRTGDSGSGATRVPTGGMQHSLSTRQVDDTNVVADYGLNFRFTPDDHWQFNFDAQHVRAEHETLDVSVFGSNFADQELDLTGNLPVITPHKPLTLSATWAAPNPTMAAQNDEQYFTDRQWTFWRAAMDHIEDSVGEEWASRADLAYNFDDGGFLRRIKFGARYSDRDQTIRYTTYNWGAISEVWSGTAVFMDQAGTERSSFFEYDNFFRGQTPGPVGGYHYNRDLIGGYRDSAEFFKSLNDYWHNVNGAGATNRWVPLNERAGVVPGTDFLPSEIQTVSERNLAAYLMASFGSDEPIFGDVRLSGNIGVRYVNTRLESEGSFTIPSAATIGVSDPFAVRCAVQPPPPGAPPGTPPSQPGGVCVLGEQGYNDLATWAGAGSNSPNTAVNEYDYFLPSLNLKFDLTDEIILRFAASRALARPSLADVRNFIQTGFDGNTGALNTTAGNPFLDPALSDQFDLGLEWYFAPVGSLTLTGFYKKIHNFFYQDVTQRAITNNGITQNVLVRGPANFDGTGKVQGFEVAYQQVYDFLPGALAGLGATASYTFIDSEGVPNSLLNGGTPVNNSPIGIAGNLPLEQLSRHNINAAVFYERGPVSVRVAYNWRSKFLLTAADVIFPYFPIFNDETGQLDASAFYSITPNLKIGIQAVNLTNEVTRTLQQFTVGGLLGPRSYFMNDRRYSFILRGNF